MSIEDFLSDLQKLGSKGFASGGIIPLPPRSIFTSVPREEQKPPRKLTPRHQRMKDKREAQKQRRINRDKSGHSL